LIHKVQGSEVAFFALRATQGRQGSTPPLAAAEASLIEKELLGDDVLMVS
jgi:hypothetical protein